MTSSLPESIDDIYKFTSTDYLRYATENKITVDTLWSKINECEGCVFFRNMAARSLVAQDYNDANASVKTIFVPRSMNIYLNNLIQSEMTPNHYISSLTIPGQLFIMPGFSPINIKVQNKNKEYMSVNV